MSRMKLEDKLAVNRYDIDRESHITVNENACQKCSLHECVFVCPAGCYKLTDNHVTFSYEGYNLAPGISKNTCDYDRDGIKESPCANIFVHDRQTGKTSLISASTKNTAANNNSVYASRSADGDWIAFQSDASNLISGDTNGQPDIYLYHR